MDRLKAEEKVKREKQAKQFNKRHRAHDLPQLHLGEPVWISDTKEKGTVITKAETPRFYLVDSPKGILCRNRSHLVSTPVALPVETSSPSRTPVLVNKYSSVVPTMDKVQTVLGRHWLWTALNESLVPDGCGNEAGLAVDLCI